MLVVHLYALVPYDRIHHSEYAVKKNVSIMRTMTHISGKYPIMFIKDTFKGIYSCKQ